MTPSRPVAWLRVTAVTVFMLASAAFAVWVVAAHGQEPVGGAPVALSDPGGSIAVVAASPSRAVVAWKQGNQIYARAVGLDGTAVGPARLMSDSGAPAGVLAGQPGADDSPAIAYDAAADRFVVVYARSLSNASEIVERRVTPDGVPDGPEIVVSDPSSSQYTGGPSIAYDAIDHRMLVSFEHQQAVANATTSIVGRLLDGAGQPLGAELPISTGHPGGVRGAIVYVPTNNTFVVVFLAPTGPANENEIFTQVLSSNGAEVDGSADTQISSVGPDGDPSYLIAQPGAALVGSTILVGWAGSGLAAAKPVAYTRTLDLAGKPTGPQTVLFSPGDASDTGRGVGGWVRVAAVPSRSAFIVVGDANAAAADQRDLWVHRIGVDGGALGPRQTLTSLGNAQLPNVAIPDGAAAGVISFEAGGVVRSLALSVPAPVAASPTPVATPPGGGLGNAAPKARAVVDLRGTLRWRVGRARVVVTRFSLRGPIGSVARIRCSRTPCKPRTVHLRGLGRAIKIPTIAGRPFKQAAGWTVTATQPGKIGQVLTFKATRTSIRTVSRCLRPGAKRSSVCPRR